MSEYIRFKYIRNRRALTACNEVPYPYIHTYTLFDCKYFCVPLVNKYFIREVVAICVVFAFVNSRKLVERLTVSKHQI